MNTPATASVKLTADSVLTPAVTVSDADNKEFELHITPFGCNIFGFKNSIHAVTPGTMYVTAGTPDEINADIAKMSVYAYQTNAQIAYELVWDTTKIRKYLALTVSDGESEKTTTTTDTADVGETKDTTQKVESTVDDATVDDE